jgi:alanyl-tRNA synthetase
VGDRLAARVDLRARSRAACNHSATHLMHAALREVLGTHVQQKGSLVDPDRTRFDFSHDRPLTAAQIADVEARVNAQIRGNGSVGARVMKYDDAIRAGAMALFGEKYGDEVRVLTMGGSRERAFSTELCGGTHVSRTGDIGFFKIVSEGGVAAGIRRVEAVTGEGALVHVQQVEGALGEAAAALKASPTELQGRIGQVLDQVRALEKEVARLTSKLASSQGEDLLARAVDVKGIRVLAASLETADAKALRETMDRLKDKLGSAAIVLAGVTEGRVSLIAGVTADLTAKLKAGDLVNHVARQVGGKGGGRPDMAQAGGSDPAALPAALASVEAWVVERV